MFQKNALCQSLLDIGSVVKMWKVNDDYSEDHDSDRQWTHSDQ